MSLCFTIHTDSNALSPLYQQQQTPHLHDTCIKWAEKSSWCHCWQLQHSTSSKDSSMCLRVLSLSLLNVSAAVLVPYQRCLQSDLWVLLWSFESVLTLLRIAVKMCMTSACSTPVAIAVSYCRLLQNSFLQWMHQHYCTFISQVYSVPNKYSCYWHVALCYNRKFLPETV